MFRTILAIACFGAGALADTIDAGRGPVTVNVPASYDGSVPTPVVILLHGYGASGSLQEAYMRFTPQSEAFGFLYLYPDGTRDQSGRRFWNATDACCDFFGRNPDDSGYIRALIDEMKRVYNVDARRVWLVGHSNGGFMCYRAACDHADAVAAIASLAGATFLDENDCTPSEPVHVLQIHGTNDTTVLYNGGCFTACYPGAVESVETWAAYDGCELTQDTSSPPLDLDSSIAGDETVVTKYTSGCARGGSGSLWTIVGGEHIPTLSADFARLVVEYLYAHPKPCPADFNNDGNANVFDFLAFQSAFGDGDPSADLNGDGQLNVFDFLAFQSAFGVAC